MQDYPAAHSMDTEWFAVDAEGNIGVFYSYENGAVPSSCSSLEIEEFIQQFPVDSQGIRHLKTDGSIVAKEADLGSLWEDIRYGGTMDNILLVLSAEEVIAEFLPYVSLRFLGAEIIIYVEECSAEKVKNLINSGKILNGKADFYLCDYAFLPGVFTYQHNWGIPAPYDRIGEPIHPLKIETLPESLQQKIKQVRFDSISFAEAKEIQPIEHMPCDTWDSDDYWLDTKRERGEWQDV